MNNKKIAIIGCGNLGLSILNGLLSVKDINPNDITVTKRNLNVLKTFEAKGVRITSDNTEAIQDSEIIIIALKPYKILEVIGQLKTNFDPKKHLIVSLATGISIDAIHKIINLPIPIFRAMPNTAAEVGVSVTCIASNAEDLEAQKSVEMCFNAIGETILINEDLMNSATVLGACGIAYALRFIRAMIQGGIQIGFDSKTANRIAAQTVKGAAELLIQRKEHPEFEIDKVTTPRGCTIAGLNEMEHHGFSSALIKGITTSFDEIEK